GAGKWRRPRGLGTQWDQGKPPGLAQQAPLTPGYQQRLEASIADQANGGQGADNRYTCITNGMPRVMAAVFPLEFVILPAITYIHFEAFMPRRIYTDGRDFPTEEEPSFMGYSIGKWSDAEATAASTRSRSRPATSRARARSSSAAFRCTTTTRPSSRSGSSSTRPTPTPCTTSSASSTTPSRSPGRWTSATAAPATCAGSRTIAPRTTTTSSSARRTI